MQVRIAPLVSIAAFCVFVLAAWQRGSMTPVGAALNPQVVVPATAQVLLYGGDRFLAASIESVRAAASGHDFDGEKSNYRLRAHRVVSQLNPCHQDNYWIGNSSLSFGGAPDAGLELLGRASQCRFWDEMPPFLYGFNQKFFRLDSVKARKAVELAADRATTNAAGFRQVAILMTVSAVKDAQAATAMLIAERDASRDPKLREMLDKRILRMKGLVALRGAQRDYEAKVGKRLDDPQRLLTAGVLASFPQDPMGLGYVFRDGEFYLQQIKVDGFN